MNISLRPVILSSFLVPLVLGLVPARATTPARSLITQRLDETKVVALSGTLRSAAADPENDRGAVADSYQLDHILLQLKRSPEREQALEDLIAQQQQSGSPNYHRWLTAAEFGEQFGASSSDIGAVTSWLTTHGFTVNQVYANRMTVDFSGSASQLLDAFHTEMHHLSVKGQAHVANMTEPQVPAALAPAIAGIVSLNDFHPHTLHKDIRATHFKPKTGAMVTGEETVANGGVKPHYTFTIDGYTYQALVPADLATIYNLTPLFNAGYSGQGQTVVVLEDTNVYSTADWTTFRSTFGLSRYTAGSFTQVHPGGCKNPGVNTDEGEAILDAEWASAAAPSATIELASCANTSTSFGAMLALQNLLNASETPPAIVSLSYGYCEAGNGASTNAAYSATFQQAVSEGVSVFVAAGDQGADGCDESGTKATHGINASGFATTAYNVAVGGTDFGDTYAGTNSTYWNSTNNTSTYGSAKSYINEIPWNNSCASQLIAEWATGSTLTYGTNGFCNSSTGEQYYLTTEAGSGAPSTCFSGSASTSKVTSGTCKGNPKPSWQRGVIGIPNDGVRDIPDVSLFAANGVWGHYYIICYSDTAHSGTPCTGAPSGWGGGGGTSYSTPIMAAMQAIVNQKTASRWGNPNPTYYKLAAAEYGTSGSSACNSSKGKDVSSSCVFYDVTQGDIDVNCTTSHDCYHPSGTNGVLSTARKSYKPAYGTTTGWDFATGIGTVNAYNLVTQWNSVSH